MRVCKYCMCIANKAWVAVQSGRVYPMRVVRRFQCNPFIIFRSYLEFSFSFSFTFHITIVFSSIFLFCSYFQLSLVAVICISFRFVSLHFILLIERTYTHFVMKCTWCIRYPSLVSTKTTLHCYHIEFHC